MTLGPSNFWKYLVELLTISKHKNNKKVLAPYNIVENFLLINFIDNIDAMEIILIGYI